MKRTISVLTFLCASLSAAAAFADQWSGTYTPAMPSRADDVDNIGNAGQFVFGVERVTGLFFDRDTLKYTSAAGVDNEATLKTTTIGLFGMSSSRGQGGMPAPSSLPRLALDFLPIDGLSVGGSLTYVNQSADLDVNAGGVESSTDAGTVSVFVVNPRAGYAFPFDETFGLWPRLGFAFASRTADFSDTDPTTGQTTTTEISQTNWQLTLDAMVVISPFTHFAAMIGPYVDIGLGGNYDATIGPLTDNRNANLLSFGASAAIVGYY
jgi:hypothetical protein